MTYILKTETGEKLDFNQVCLRYSIPPNVLAWRLAKGMPQGELKKKPRTLIHHFGQIFTPAMLAEISGLKPDTIHKRYEAGLRGADLVKPLHEARSAYGKSKSKHATETEDERKEKLVAQCKRHLDALRKAHPNRDPAMRPTSEELPSANGRLNAARLVGRARRDIRSYDRF